jgi:AcrR family transcriptional regulator
VKESDEKHTKGLPIPQSNELQLTKNGHKRVRRGNVNDAESIRRNLIKAANELFAEGGLGAVTMRDVAARAEVAIMTPYTYFKNKSDLLWHIKNSVIQELLEDQVNAISEANSPRDVIRASSLAFLKFWVNRLEKYRLMYLPLSLEGKEVLVWGSESKEIADLRELQRRITAEFANYVGGNLQNVQAAIGFRHATTLGFIHLNIVNPGGHKNTEESMQSMTNVMIDAVEIMLKKSLNEKPTESA